MEVANGTASSSREIKEAPAVVDVLQDLEANHEREGLVSNLPRSSDPITSSGRNRSRLTELCPGLLGDRSNIITGMFFAFLAIVMIAVWSAAVSFLAHRDELHVRFLVIGDWGRNGESNQTLVAHSMARITDRMNLNFVISTGDNFYESGLTHPDDDQFRTSFMDVYTGRSLQVPWYAVLGNHDYGELWQGNPLERPPNCPEVGNCFYSPLHELSVKLWERDRRWHCQRYYKLQAGGGAVDLFFIDTNPFLKLYHGVPWYYNEGGLVEQSWKAQLAELEADLARSRARWKLVIGHHPVRNAHVVPGTVDPNTAELVQYLEPLLEKYGVRLYMSGHEHNLQHLHVDGATPHYIISGGGSKSDYDWNTAGAGVAKFFYQGSGFTVCEVRDLVLACDMFGILSDAPVYSLQIPFREPGG
eukprot:jgi/Botrbrau1/509/Bobra.110_2s0138.1